MPDEVKSLCRLADINSKSLLLEIVRQRDPKKMVALIEQMTREGGVTRAPGPAGLGQAENKAGEPRAFVYTYKAPNKTFNLRLAFRKSRVPQEELIEALEGILEELRAKG